METGKDLTDYSKFDEIFENMPVKQVQPEHLLHAERQNYMVKNALNWKFSEPIPEIEGLTNRTFWKVPNTRRWLRRVIFRERSGYLNIMTRPMLTKIFYWGIYFGLFWGMTSHVTCGIWKERNEVFNDEFKTYDKLHPRKIPYNTIWNRPG